MLRVVAVGATAALLLVELVAVGLVSTALLGTPAYAAGGQAITRTFQAPATTDAGFRDSFINSRNNTTNNGNETTMDVRSTGAASCSTTAVGNSCSRSLLWFDLSSLPAGSTISAASVSVSATTAGSASRTHGLHKVAASWTETGVTWNSRDGATNWTAPGGDFNAAASQTVSTGTTTGVKTYPDVAALRTDVSAWVDNSANNFGWIAKDQSEANSSNVAWTYGAKQNTTASNRPTLSVTFIAVWDSYNNSPRSVQDDTFQTGENTVYMRGTGFNLGGSYAVGHYDGSGDKRCTEVVAASAGTLDSSCQFLGAAAPGTWNAVVFEPLQSAAATYGSITHDGDKVLADDTFTVESGAIVPEIPSIVAALLVGAATVATFWWFGRRSSKAAFR